jgi:hypothetical protein
VHTVSSIGEHAGVALGYQHATPERDCAVANALAARAGAPALFLVPRDGRAMDASARAEEDPENASDLELAAPTGFEPVSPP